VEEILHQAKEQEKKYDWLGAAESYNNALRLVPEQDFSRRGEICERLGQARYRAAFQAESQEGFRDMMNYSVVDYGHAVEFYGKLAGSIARNKVLRCNAMIAYGNFWSAAEVSDRRRLLDECWRIEKEALENYDENEDRLGMGKNCNELANCMIDRLDLELDVHSRERLLDEALCLGEKAIQIFSTARDEHELAKAYCTTGIHCYNAAMSLQLETKRRECKQKAFDYSREAIRLSEKIGDKLLLGRSTICLGNAEHDLGSGAETAVEFFKRGLQCGIETRDNSILSEAFDGLTESTYWNLTLEEDLEKMREKSKRCEEYASQAISCSILTNYSRGVPHSYGWGYVANLTSLSRREIDPEIRHELLDKAVTLGKQGLEYAQRTGSPHAIFHVSAELSIAMYNLSKTETGSKKRQLIEEALKLGEKAVCYTESLRPHFMWAQAKSTEPLALTLFELGKLGESNEKRKELLEKSVSGMEKCIASMQVHIASFPLRKDIDIASLGQYQLELGNILNQLYQTTAQKEILRRLIKACQIAIEMYEKANLFSRIAEALWQKAVAYDLLGEYLESANSFELASKQFELSTQNISQLKNFYQEHARYMQAWSEIERAHHHHSRQEYGSAKQHFERAADLHKSLKKWSYLAPNYFAWVQVEDAEDLSRKERIEEAINAFKQADSLFNEARKSLEVQLSKIEDSDEKQMVADLVKATGMRQAYCMARIALEQARMMDKEGDHYSSSEKYGSAAKAFEKIGESVESDQERREIKFTINLSRAWQKMTLAEAKSSPALYMDASQLFEQTEDLSPNEKTKMLVLGHSRFCRALEAGTKYVDTRDPAMHVAAVLHLASASNYYVRADFLNASEYAKATKLLFDAYAYMDNAERESDPDKKAKLYAMVEKVLQTSAGSFTKAEHPEKREQVLKLLEKAREERELATSLTEVLHAPSIVSTTRVLTAPTPTQEEAVGSERFEHADVQANLIIRQKELKIGENLSIELELVNAGRGFALLTKVTEIIPKGFELAEKPDNCRVEDSYLNMKGKRLDPLKTEEVKLVLKPTVQGTFSLKPTVLYLDENGKYKSHEPEPVTITVKELGIKGWIKGER
jgi:tetratricopeptide (TPR) repeat protein